MTRQAEASTMAAKATSNWGEETTRGGLNHKTHKTHGLIQLNRRIRLGVESPEKVRNPLKAQNWNPADRRTEDVVPFAAATQLVMLLARPLILRGF